jgi:hypothetical protein
MGDEQCPRKALEQASGVQKGALFTGGHFDFDATGQRRRAPAEATR